MKKIFIALAMLFMSASLFADICSTQSKGISFVSFVSGINQATSDVLGKCTQCSVTSNTECSANLACGRWAVNPYSSGRVICRTNSRNISFQLVGDVQSVLAMTNSVVAQCNNSPSTDNRECAANASCQDFGGTDPNVVRCTTLSHRIDFEQVGPRSRVDAISRAVLSLCNTNVVTDNRECSQNLRCD